MLPLLLQICEVPLNSAFGRCTGRHVPTNKNKNRTSLFDVQHTKRAILCICSLIRAFSVCLYIIAQDKALSSTTKYSYFLISP